MIRKMTIPFIILLSFAAMLSLSACSLMRWDSSSSTASAGSKAASKTASSAVSKASSSGSASKPVVTSSASTALRDYTSGQYGVSLSYPADWQLSEGEMDSVCIIKAPQTAGGINATVTTQALSNTKQTLYALNSTTLSRLSSSEPKFSQVANDEIKMAGGFGYKIDYTTLQAKVTQRVVKYLCIKNGRQYMLTCTAPADSYDNYALQFSNILKSIAIK